MDFEIKTIHHNDQRYDTVGDWQIIEGDLLVTVSYMRDPRYEFLVGIHEMVEAFLCSHRGISSKVVDNYDMESQSSDPGSEPDCPYRKEHEFALGIEQLIAQEIGIDWDEYEKHLSEVGR